MAGKAMFSGNKLKIAFAGNKIKKGMWAGNVIYSSGNFVTYYVDSGVSYTEEVDEGASCLSPNTFTPTKSGWEFVGWRTDATANGTVLASNVMGDDTITLFAVFRQSVTVTYYNGSATKQTKSGYRYYNNGNTVNPSFTITQTALSGWTARGWSTGTAGNSAITYNNGVAFTRDSDVTLYGMYQQTITVTYYDNSTTAKTTTGTRYYNSGKNVYTNPSFTLTQTASSGWTLRGWSTSNAGNAAITYANGATFTRDSNVTLYGLYQQTITVTYYNNSTTASTTTGTRYWAPAGYINPSFTLTQTAKSGWTARGWSTGTAGNAGLEYDNGVAFTRGSNVTLYGMYYQTITLSYNGNGSTSGSTAAQTGTRYYNSGKNVYTNPIFVLSASGFAKTGYNFSKWAIGSASGTQYAVGASVTLSESTTFYAVWEIASKVIVSNVTASRDNYVIPVNMSYNLSGYKTLRLVMTASFTNQNRGPYDNISLFIGDAIYYLVQNQGLSSYSIDKTFDISGQVGAKTILIECSFNGDEELDVTATANVKQIVLYP